MDKEQKAISRLIQASRDSERFYGKPLIVTTSGGKDSSVCLHLALKSGIDFELMHNHTTVDAPETVRFIRSEFKRLEDMGFPANQIITTYPYYKGARTSMWNLISKHVLMPPTRTKRYCCNYLKEYGGQGRYIVTGVRWDESVSRGNRGIYELLAKRKKDNIILNNDNDDAREMFETCYRKQKAVCNPIIDWTNSDVWNYIRSERIPVNPLYERGYHRVGCIGCPMSQLKGRSRDFARYPKYKQAYLRAFARMLEARRRRGIVDTRWGETAEDVFHWWLNDGVLPGQRDLFGEETAT